MTPPDSNSIQGQQLEALSRKETEIYYQRLKAVADRAVALSTSTLDHYIKICRMISPERVKEIEEKYPGISLDDPAPIEELTSNITSAVNLLLLARASAQIDVGEALQKLHEENIMLTGQLRQSNQTIRQLQKENSTLRKEHEQQQKGKGRGAERSYGPQQTTRQVAPLDEEPQAPPPVEEADEVREEGTKAAKKSVPIGDKSLEEQHMGAALETWKDIASKLTEKKKEMYYPLIEIIGTGIVKKTEIQEKIKSQAGVDEKTVERQLADLTREPVLLKVRDYTLGERSKPGRKPAAYELTTLGKAAYRSITGQIESLPEDVVLTKAHKDPDHGDMVKRTAIALTRLGFVATPNNAPIKLDDGAMFDPDIKVVGPDMKVFFVEAENPNHMKYKDLHTKWALSVRVNGNKVYLVMRKKADAESLGYSIIRQWALEVNYPEEITVYLTGLDFLESMEKPQKGQRLSPWIKIKTIKPTGQTELIP